MLLSIKLSTGSCLTVLTHLALTYIVPACLLASNTLDSTTGPVSSTESYGSDSLPPNPGAALEGNCIVVCDALVPSNLPTQPLPRDKPPRRLAFTVLKNDNLIINYPEENSRTIMFDHILLDIGNTFDLTKGTFTAKVNGIYSFHFTVFKNFNRDPLTVALTVSGVTKLTGFAESSVARHNMAHNSGLLSLLEGDVVRLEIKDGNLDGGWQHSTFSGYLLYEE